MKVDEKLKLLETEIQQQISVFDRRQLRNRRLALFYRVFVVVAAATSTVILGLNVDAGWTATLKNIALTLGALIAVTSAVEAFFDNRNLWIRQFVTLMHLHDLKRDLQYYIAGIELNELDVAQLDSFKARFDHIIQDNIQEWMQLRGGTLPNTRHPSGISTS